MDNNKLVVTLDFLDEVITKLENDYDTKIAMLNDKITILTGKLDLLDQKLQGTTRKYESLYVGEMLVGSIDKS